LNCSINRTADETSPSKNDKITRSYIPFAIKIINLHKVLVFDNISSLKSNRIELHSVRRINIIKFKRSSKFPISKIILQKNILLFYFLDHKMHKYFLLIIYKALKLFAAMKSPANLWNSR